MTIDTKLRDAAESVREARKHAEFTVVAPGVRRPIGTGLRVAAVVAVLALLSVGIPALLRGVDSNKSGDVAGLTGDTTASSQPESEDSAVTTTVAVGDNTSGEVTPGDAPAGFPFLALDTPGWNPTYTQTTSEGGFSAEINYERMTEDGSGGLIVLRTQASGPFDRFQDLASMSTDSEQVTVAGREMTLLHIPKELVVEESDSDVYAASWMEGDTSEGYAIAFGLERHEFLDTLVGLANPSGELWQELALMSPQVATTTTMIEPAGGDTP